MAKQQQQQQLSSLQEDFPDMSQSVLGDVLSVYENNKEAAAAALKGIDEESKKEQEKKVSELRELFPEATTAEIDATLKTTSGNVDEAIVTLFNYFEAKKKESTRDTTRKRRVNEDKAREVKKQAENLMEVFHTIPKDQIQQLLDENDGDIEETTTQLLTLVARQEDETASRKNEEEERMRKEQEMRLRELKIQALEEKFEDLSEKEVIGGLEKAKWDIKKAFAELTQLSASKRNNPIVVKKIQQTLLQESLVLGQQMEDDILASHTEFTKAIGEESKVLFRQNLEHIIETQARHGVSPGMAPPLPREIEDRRSAKGKPVAEVQEPSLDCSKEPPVQQERKVSVGENSVILEAHPQIVDAGDTITVSWEILKGESSTSDWIGFFSVDKPNKQYYTYNWRGKNDSTKGQVTFAAPKYNGEYEFRYFLNGSYEHVAMSNRIKVGPRYEIKATQCDGKFIAHWNQLSGNKYSRQWIGLYEKSQTDNSQYLTWEYASTPEVKFDAPVKPQQYEFRIFSNSYVDLARSNSIRIDGEDKLSATISDDCSTITVVPEIVSVDPYYESAWIGVFFTSEPDNRQWRRYKYLAERNKPVTFKSPRTPGQYEIRLFANKTYNALLTSNSFVIPEKQ